MPLHWHVSFACRQAAFLQWLDSNMNARNIKRTLVFLSSQCLKSIQQHSWVALFHCSIIFDFYIMDGLQPTQPSVLRENAQIEDALALARDPGLVLSVAWICSSWGAKLLAYRAAPPLCKGRLRHSPSHPLRFLISVCEPHCKANQIPSNIAAWCSISETEVQWTIPSQNLPKQNVTPKTTTSLFASQTCSLPQLIFRLLGLDFLGADDSQELASHSGVSKGTVTF